MVNEPEKVYSSTRFRFIRLKPVGRVCEVQTQIEIEEFKTPANSGLPFDGKARKKVQVWWPVWTEITPVATAQASLPQ